jgi:hypothetical protein
MNSKKLSGLILATAAAGMFGLAPVATVAAAEMAKVHCEGVNSCKSHGDCKGENGCKGKNSCKGKGFLEMTQEECDAAKAMMEDEMMKR